MREEEETLSQPEAEPDQGRVRRPYRVRLPGFVTGDELGLGDVVKQATSVAGIRPCSGCQRRAAAMNRWLVFSPRGRP